MTDKSIFCTETAAKMLESQGYKAKAAEVYLFLSMNCPDKKEYYRARFEELSSDLVWIKKNVDLINLMDLWLREISGSKSIERLIKARKNLFERKKHL